MLEQVAHHAEADTQQAVAAFFDLDVMHKTKRVAQKDESVRLEITISKGLAQKIEQAQGLVSHAVPTKDLAAFLEYVSDRIIREKVQAPNSSTKSQSTSSAGSADSTATMVVRPAAASISLRVHRVVRSQQPKCVNCGSQWFPQMDHKKSK